MITEPNGKGNNMLRMSGLVAACLLLVGWPGRAQAELKINDTVMVYTDDTMYMDYLRWCLIDPSKRTDPKWTDKTQVRDLEDPIRRQIFDRMKVNTETFSYTVTKNTADQIAEQTFTMRIEAIRVMRAMNAGTIKFKYSKDTGGVKVPAGGKWEKGTPQFYFKRKADTSSAAAIDDLLGSTTDIGGECAGAVTVCYFAGARKVLGATGFDAVHPNADPFTIGWGASIDKHLYTATDTDITHLIPGDRIYMVNADYGDKCPTGIAAGESTIYIGVISGDQQYAGLGAFADGVTEADLKAALIRTYKRDVGSDPDATAVKWRTTTIFRCKVK
jgi:hypothetical protein